MGQNKLLLPWPGSEQYSVLSAQCSVLSTQNSRPGPTEQQHLGQRRVGEQSDAHHSIVGSTDGLSSSRTVIDRVLEAWATSRVTEIIVVIRSDDLELREICRRWPVTIVHPLEATLDMKGSVCVALNSLIDRDVPLRSTRCFIAPADLPGLSSQVIDGLIDAQSEDLTILMPRFGKSLATSVSGHPVLLPWEWTNEIFSLGPHEGVDAILKRHPQEFVLFPPELAVTDIDTPMEYRAAVDRARLNQ